MHILLAHEMPGLGGQEARGGCPFGAFIDESGEGATPPELLKRGVYSDIAVPLKGGPWREASMVLLHMALARGQNAFLDPADKLASFAKETANFLRAASGKRLEATAAPHIKVRRASWGRVELARPVARGARAVQR